MKPVTLALLALPLLAAPARAAEPRPSADQVAFFEKNVRPVLVDNCVSCHGPKKQRGGLRLDSRAGALKGGDSGPAVVPGQPGRSPLIKAVRHEGELAMPPKGKLSAKAQADLVAWVQLGAPWPDLVAAAESGGLRPPGTPITAADRAFWSFRPVAAPPVPAVKDGAWARRPLDRFVLAKLEEKGLRPVAPAARRALIRRATLDLTGLPPTPEEVEAFINDASPDAWVKVVDRLLASPHYGERWGRHWLDVARYGEDQAHTFQARLYPHGWRYRDWVIRAYNGDLPYDRFIVEQIAGDLLPDDPIHGLAAVGFCATGPVYYADAGELKAAQAAELDDRIDTLTRGFLGLTVSCARCHDHKFDPITVQDYYALAGVFRSTTYRLAPLARPEEAKRFEAAQALVKEHEGKVKRFLDEQTTRVAEGLSGETARYAVAAWKLQTRRNTNPRLNAAAIAREEKLQAPLVEGWSRYLFRRGADKRAHLAGWRKALAGIPANKDLSKDQIALYRVKVAAEALQAETKELLRRRDEGKLPPGGAEALRDLFGPQGPFKLPPGQVEGRLSGEMKKALAGMRRELDQAKKAVPVLPVVHSLADAKGADMRVYVRGNPHKEGDLVPRRFLTVLSPGEPVRFTHGSGRLELARAIASPDNPLTARVMVNRVWLSLFGQGLVGTPSNFGSLGERPTHPELLDHLALFLMEHGWSIKALQREILLSATYQLSCDRDARNAEADPANRLLWRMNRRRLDVEAWRDALLAASGSLDLSFGGPSQNLAGGSRRRTVYGAVSRHNLDQLLRLFDFPDPNLTSEKRPVTTVPLQQLFVLNSEFMVAQARALVAALPAGDDEARIRAAHLRLYGRPARADEVALGREFLRTPAPPGEPRPSLTAWEQYAQVLLAANEMTFVD
jgi:cytochrome c553